MNSATQPYDTTPQHSLMNLTRLEAFSDGVFSIAATLLVLEFKIPDLHHASTAHVIHVLAGQWRSLLAYVTSFFVIGVIWINHHPIFKGLTDVDRWTVVLNLVLLIVVAFLPFPTEIIAEYGAEQPVTVVLYGAVQAACGIAFIALSLYVERRYRLSSEHRVSSRAIVLSRLWSLAHPLLALLAAALAFIAPNVSMAIYVALPLAYLMPNAIEYQLTRGRSADRTGSSST